MIDYENDLAFKPAMTWGELCEWAKSKGAWTGFAKFGHLEFNNISFTKEGRLYDVDDNTIAENRTYEQMKNIIDNLYGE